MTTNRLCTMRVRQRGAVLILSLIILVVLLGASAALVRSMDTSMFLAGNLAFKRDLMNQAERAVPVVLDALTTGALSTATARANDLKSSNYSARVLPSTDQGIPDALLLTDTAFEALSYATGGNDIAVSAQDVTIRYVIDRLSVATGEESTLGDAYVAAGNTAPKGGSGSQLRRSEDAAAAAPVAGSPTSPSAGAVTPQAVYRISLRVTGPRDTQAFLQTTLTR
ncbi:hypothetical protein [Methylibium sp.]|uniref:hypothetical protein n=1 Tax=Methylibium sp. TaxID=2067992 RepID=UPI001794787D|nr:hypothetical protein [Methylibium sp.]MBA3588961.1 hypothetical protein [Methylibium sp.]